MNIAPQKQEMTRNFPDITRHEGRLILLFIGPLHLLLDSVRREFQCLTFYLIKYESMSNTILRINRNNVN